MVRPIDKLHERLDLFISSIRHLWHLSFPSLQSFFHAEIEIHPSHKIRDEDLHASLSLLKYPIGISYLFWNIDFSADPPHR